MNSHISRIAMEAFLDGGLRPGEAEWISVHLDSDRCIDCLLLAREVLSDAETMARESSRGLFLLATTAVLDKEERKSGLQTLLLKTDRRSRIIDAERHVAPELLSELELHPKDQRVALIRSQARFQLLGLAEHLCQAAREAWSWRPRRAIELAALAVEVADSLDLRIYGSKTKADERAGARAYLGNARRLVSDLWGAQAAFRDALSLLAGGNRSSPVRGEVLAFYGSLRLDQGRYSEAGRALQRSIESYRRLDLQSGEAKATILLADAHGYAGHPEHAVGLLGDALAVLEELDEPYLGATAFHNFTDWLVEAGRARTALDLSWKSRDQLNEHYEEPPRRLRLRWLEGRAFAALDHLELARHALEEVRSTAVDRGLAYEVAIVDLDLANVHLAAGNRRRALQLATESLPLLRSIGLTRHQLVALALARRAS